MPDWLGEGTVGANGIGTVALEQNNSSAIWEIEQIGVSVGSNSTTGNIVIWKNGNLVAPTSVLVPQINPFGIASIGQTAAGLPYVYLRAADEIDVVVNNCSPGDSVNVRVQYREFPLSDPDMAGR